MVVGRGATSLNLGNDAAAWLERMYEVGASSGDEPILWSKNHLSAEIDFVEQLCNDILQRGTLGSEYMDDVYSFLVCGDVRLKRSGQFVDPFHLEIFCGGGQFAH